MKITLISPQPDLKAFGVRSLSACLKKDGYDVQIIFLANPYNKVYKEEALKDMIELVKGADLIGITVMTDFLKNAIQITQKLKKDLKMPIIWGGIHPTIKPRECLKYADVVCIGEGEQTIIEIADNIKNGQGYYNTPGVWFKHKGHIIKNTARPLIQNLDSLPFLDYDCKDHYLLDCYVNDTKIFRLDEETLAKYTIKMKRSPVYKPLKVYPTMTSRGCPFQCAYCVNNFLNKLYPNQKQIRSRSVNNIIAELIQIKKKGLFDYIKFDDDSFFSNTEDYIQDFCCQYKKYIKLPLMIPGAVPTTLTQKKLSLLVDAGLIFVRMGIEAGCERTRKLYKRYHSNKQIEEATKIINQFKDKLWPPQYDIILDNPWETENDLIETLIFLTKLPLPYQLSLFSLCFYPGTELYEKAKKERMISDNTKEGYSQDFRVYQKNYLNKLFFLLKKFTSAGRGISPGIMILLTNSTLRRLRLSLGLYLILTTNIKFIKLLKKLKKGLNELQNGEWSKLTVYFTTTIKHRLYNSN